MRILMFGWEFPPYKTGGLGTACYDLTKGLSRNSIKVSFVMPSVPSNLKADFVKLLGTNNIKVKIKSINSLLTPYSTVNSYDEKCKTIYGSNSSSLYGRNLLQEVERYSIIASQYANSEPHDVIHVHDWMTYKAGILAKEISGKPLVAHIHATEFDRTGGNPNPDISHREYEGLSRSDLIIANSYFTKNNVVAQYKISPDKIRVVHWGIDPDNFSKAIDSDSVLKKDKLVLFLGRITVQKGPDYFVDVANKVLRFNKDVKFVVAGNGDMLPSVINRAGELNILDKFLFAGFLKGDDVHRAFRMADVYVMPSVSEPFGLVALEALKNNTPIIISKQSGVSEVVNHCIKTDFWDTDKMADSIISILRYPALQSEMKRNGFIEANKFNLDVPARKVIDCYKEVLS